MTLKITTIGGGSGQPPVIIGICKLLHDLDVQFDSITGTWDSGGSSGQLRDIYGIMPPGDILKTMMAYVPPENRLLADSLLRRFDKTYLTELRSAKPSSKMMTPTLANHNAGNLLLTSMQHQYGIISSIRILEKLFGSLGKTHPITECDTTLHAEMQRVKAVIVDKESDIDERLDANYKITKLWLEPEIKAIYPRQILENTDVLVISPGSIFTSIVPHFGLKETNQLCKRIKTRIMVANLVDKRINADEYVSAMCQWMDIKPTHIIFNSIACDNENYKANGCKQLKIPKDKEIDGIPCISRPILRHDRKLHRHDPKRTGAAIVEILSKEEII